MKEILRSHWSYIFYQDEDKYLLSVMCGTVGLFDRNVYLDEDEEENYKNSGKDYIEELAKKIRNSPSDYEERHVVLPTE